MRKRYWKRHEKQKYNEKIERKKKMICRKKKKVRNESVQQKMRKHNWKDHEKQKCKDEIERKNCEGQ